MEGRSEKVKKEELERWARNPKGLRSSELIDSYTIYSKERKKFLLFK